MAAELKLKFRKLTISNKNSPDCQNKSVGKCLVRSTRMVPTCGFKCTVKSPAEVDISVKNTRAPSYQKNKRVTHNIKATGCYSNVHVVLMYGTTKDNKSRTHWGIILQQQKQWVMDGKSRQCILFHHMGNGVEIAVGCLSCLRNTVRGVYGDGVPDPKLICFDAGRSNAAVRRFMSDDSLGVNVAYQYNNKYKDGEAYFKFCTTNCCRLVFDTLFYLKLEYSYALKMINTYNGLEHWNDVFRTIYKEYPDFCKIILEFYKRLFCSTVPELQKVAALLDGQYRLGKAYDYYQILQSGGLVGAFASLLL